MDGGIISDPIFKTESLIKLNKNSKYREHPFYLTCIKCSYKLTQNHFKYDKSMQNGGKLNSMFKCSNLVRAGIKKEFRIIFQEHSFR